MPCHSYICNVLALRRFRFCFASSRGRRCSWRLTPQCAAAFARVPNLRCCASSSRSSKRRSLLWHTHARRVVVKEKEKVCVCVSVCGMCLLARQARLLPLIKRVGKLFGVCRRHSVATQNEHSGELVCVHARPKGALSVRLAVAFVDGTLPNLQNAAATAARLFRCLPPQLSFASAFFSASLQC